MGAVARSTARCLALGAGLVLAVAAAGCLDLTFGDGPSDPSVPRKLVIVHSTDSHAKYLPFWMEPNMFDKDMGLESRLPPCWDLNWSGAASYCDGAYDRGRGAYRIWTGGRYQWLTAAQVASGGHLIEDLNHDGVCDVRDCQRCWDLDRDNVCDPAEDVFQDGASDVGCDERDCEAQPDRPAVFACWDTGGPSDRGTPDGQCQAYEDLNRDRACDLQDCIYVWDRDHDRVCDHPWYPAGHTWLDVNGVPIVRSLYASENDYQVALNFARGNSEDTNRDGACTFSDYRPGLVNTGGVARISTLQKRIAARHGPQVPILRLDSGDTFQGAPQYNLYRGELEMATVMKLGVDALAIGNHEFDSGVGELVAAWHKAGGVPLMAANYLFDAEDNAGLADITLPYIVFQRGGVTVGVVGLGNDTTLTSVYNASGSVGFNAYEPGEIAQRYVDLLRGQVDVIVLLSHLGLDGDYLLAERVRGVDVILGGHHHVILDPVKVMQGPDGRNVLVVHSGVNYKVLAELELAVRDRRVVWHRYTVHPVSDALPMDPFMLNVLEPYQQALAYAQDLTLVVGEAAAAIKRTDPNGGDSPLGNLVTDAMLQHEMARAQFAVTNSLGIRADIPSGAITIEKLYEVFPFENTIVTMYLSGQELKEMFDFIARRSASRGCNTQVQVSGLSVELDCSPSADLVAAHNSYALTRRLVIGDTVVVDNYELLQAHMVWKMATNDYMGQGGSGFDMLERNTTRLDTAVSLRDAVVEFLQVKGLVHPLAFTSGLGDEPKRITMIN